MVSPVPLRASRAALIAATPVVIAQGRAVRRTTIGLPPATGPSTVEAATGFAGTPIRMLVLGDSTVAGIGVGTHVEGLTGALARQLAHRVGRPVSATAIGRGGATSADLVAEFVDDAVAAGPWDAVFLSIGANDAMTARSRGAFVRDLGTVLDRLAAGSPDAVVMISSLPAFRLFELLPQPLRWNLDLHARSLEAAARRFAGRRARTWMTPPVPGYGPDFFAADRFHPGVVGYAAWGEWAIDEAMAAGVLEALRPASA